VIARTRTLLAAALLLAGCGSGQSGSSHSRVSPAEAADQIKPDLQRQLRRNLGDDSIVVDSVDCVITSRTAGKCIAQASDSTGEKTSIGLSLDIDPDTGRYIWQESG
jgi:hypothetical protein